MIGPAAAPSGVFTIPAGVRFVDVLARGLLEANAGAPAALAAITVLLPNRRSCRALIDAFAAQSRAGAALLPTISPIGEIDDGETLSVEDLDDGTGLGLPPAIPELRRQLLLTRLVLATPGETGVSDPAQAARLARALAGLLDQVHTERIGFERLVELAPAELAAHWEITLGFLRLLTEHWPAILEAEGALDPARRRNLVIERRIEAWRARRPAGPVIIAGSTGSIPAVRELMAFVHRFSLGAIVLPGLDRTLAEPDLPALGPTHPQFGLVQLLVDLKVRPVDVVLWPGAELPPEAVQRGRLIATAMRPAETPPDPIDEASLAGAASAVTRIDCAGPREEATTIALLLREALETEGKTAALVTPDRDLARRVAAELRRWDIEIDDSGGRRLDLTPPGAFLRLTARLAAERWAPVPLLAALKHPMAAGGLDRGVFLRRVRTLERRVLRGPRPEPGPDGLIRTLEDAGATADMVRWLKGVRAAMAPLGRDHAAPVSQLVADHVACVEALAATDRTDGAERMWAGGAGEAAAVFLSELAGAGRDFGAVMVRDWPDLLETLMRPQVVRPRHVGHDRIGIWGVLEARLIGADRMILGGLNDGTWPAAPPPDPWMSRPMRAAFGLPPHERRIGLAAHDFAQAFAAPELFLTRATRLAGTPTVPSRWLLRLENAVPGTAPDFRRGAARPLAWQRALDRPAVSERLLPPAPTPPLAARPRSLSVTQIETLIRDPYAVYARSVLGLRALEDIDADPGAAEQGIFVHQALDRFLCAFPGALPENGRALLLDMGRDALGLLVHRPVVGAFWWPRFERVADWFLAQERERRAWIARTLTEITGSMTIPAPAGPFTLTAKADRIDLGEDGSITIIDYKTGALPKKQDIEAGAAPQLPLEAAILEAGGFETIAAAPVAELAYWRLSGGNPPGETASIAGADPGLIARTREGLLHLIAAYDNPETAYEPQPDPRLAPRYSDYRHLERLDAYAQTRGSDP